MTDIQAALGQPTGRLDEFVQRRHDLAERYDQALADLPLTLPWQHPDTYSAFHLYVVQIDADKRLDVFTKLRAANIGVNVHYIPVHTQPFYQQLGYGWGLFPVSERYYAGAVSLPLFAGMTEPQQDRVIAVLKDLLS